MAPAATAATIEISENLIYDAQRGGIALQAGEVLNAPSDHTIFSRVLP